MQKKNVLITGAAGFISQHLIKFMNNLGCYNLFYVDRLSPISNKQFWDKLPEDNKFHMNISYVDERFLERNKIDVVLNLAAESHVDRSISGPMLFTENNTLATHALLDACRKYGKLSRFVQVGCYDDKTRALTTDGFKTYEEIKIGDKVLSINPETKKIEEKKVLNVISMDYSGKMLQFNGKYSNSCVTTNHRVYHEDKDGNVIWKRADDIIDENVGYLLSGKFDGIISDETFVDGIGNVDTDALFYISGVFAGDGFLAPSTTKRPTKSGLNKTEYMKNRNEKGHFVKIDMPLGEHICENTCYRIFWDVPEKDKARIKLEECFKKLGIKYSSQKGKSGEHLYFSSKEWSKYFEQFGNGFINKQIPLWMKSYDKKHLEHLFYGLIDSDGHYIKDKSYGFTTSSEKLLSDICEIGTKLGFITCFNSRDNRSSVFKKENRKIIQKHTSYDVRFKNYQKYNFFTQKEYVNYNGKVWCLQVEDNKNFLTERFGMLRICGNTDEEFGSLGSQDYPFRETNNLSPRSPYAVSKASQSLMALSYYETYGLPVVVTRCSNNYGEWQNPEKLIPKALKCLLTCEKIPVYGSGQNVRDWIHAIDHASGICHAMEYGRNGECYNFGSDNELDNLTLLRLIVDEFFAEKALTNDDEDEHFIFVDDRLGHDFRYGIDSFKAKSELGWYPVIKFNDGIKNLVAWAKDNKEWLLNN